MKTFKDLIDSGIAPIHTCEWGTSDISNVCPVKRDLIVKYNNQFGLSNDTHLDQCECGLVITGSFVSYTDRFLNFLDSKVWQRVVFPCTPRQLFASGGYTEGHFDFLNGQTVWIFDDPKPTEVAPQ